MGIDMKVGIITFHKVNNYGAVLQAYALQKTIRKLGYECNIIDYGRKNLKDILLWQENKITCILQGKPDRQAYSDIEFLHMFFNTVFFNNRTISGKFNDFRKRLMLSPPVNSDNIRKLNSEYDLFLSGSDQVWNCGRVYLDKNYFLDFVERNEKKGSYAASFGIKDIPDKYMTDYKRLLSDYQYLSVRETIGASIIKYLTGRKAEVVLDPTLLLRKGEWEELIGKNKQKESVIVIYMLEYSKNLIRFAEKLSLMTGYPIRLLNKPYNHKVSAECKTDIGPLEWLEELLYAEFVVTNTFHGVAFSINFNKNFFVEIAEERIRGAMGSRIEDILDNFGLKDRLINRYHSDNTDKIKLQIDYDDTNLKLEELRHHSLTYLINMLKYADGSNA
jgi:hypothetical protein